MREILKFNFQKGWSLIELIICICLISICVSVSIRASTTNNTMTTSSQIKSIFLLAQAIASYQNNSIWLSSSNWVDIGVFNSKTSIKQRIYTHEKIKYRGFLSTNTIRISSLGFTHNNGSFYIIPSQRVINVNKSLRVL